MKVSFPPIAARETSKLCDRDKTKDHGLSHQEAKPTRKVLPNLSQQAMKQPVTKFYSLVTPHISPAIHWKDDAKNEADGKRKIRLEKEEKISTSNAELLFEVLRNYRSKFCGITVRGGAEYEGCSKRFGKGLPTLGKE